jgi:hypothetical protein
MAAAIGKSLNAARALLRRFPGTASHATPLAASGTALASPKPMKRTNAPARARDCARFAEYTFAPSFGGNGM